MLEKQINVNDFEGSVQEIISYLEGTRNTPFEAIYFDGKDGIGASAALRAIAEQESSSSLRRKFTKIVHVDCSRWKSRRALQRQIVGQLGLTTKLVMAAFDRQDEEDDYSGVDEGSRLEIGEVGKIIHRSLQDHTCLVVFHNGSSDMVDLQDLGIPRFKFFDTKVLWTFCGRLRLFSDFVSKVDESHLFLWIEKCNVSKHIKAEAREIALYTHKPDVTPEIAMDCCLYLLSLDNEKRKQSVEDMSFNWSIHTSNYWVCDGIIQGGHGEEAWDLAAAIHHELRWNDNHYVSPNMAPRCSERWAVVKNYKQNRPAYSESTTSLFIIGSDPLLRNRMFHQLGKLRVLKLCCCTFSFSAPPFSSCHTLRFLGLERCKDQGGEYSEEKQATDSVAVQLFETLWVLDVCYTDRETANLVGQINTNIREVNIKRGKVWRKDFPWRQLQNLRKLRVVEPTSSWETGNKDEFTGMVKLELLDLSGNSTIQVLPSLSGATGIKTLVLDGCIGLEHVGPGELPPLLETFSLDAAGSSINGYGKLSRISLVGCVHLKNFVLGGSLPRLKELNLSGTSVGKVDLSKVLHAMRFKKVLLLGCKQLRAILWWEGIKNHLEVLCIDTLGAKERIEEPPYPDFSSSCGTIQKLNYDGYVSAGDVRILQSLVLKYNSFITNRFITNSFYLDLHVVPPPGSSSRSKAQSNISKPFCYKDIVVFEETISATAHGGIPWPVASNHHVSIGEGITLTNVESDRGIFATCHIVHTLTGSLHVHDNSCILSVTPKLTRDLLNDQQTVYGIGIIWSPLKWCLVERCPELEAVFASHHSGFSYTFSGLEDIRATDLRAARCIWSKGVIWRVHWTVLGALRRIQVHNCPRLKSVLPCHPDTPLPSLETLHITNCGDLTEVFPWEDDVVVPEQCPRGHFPKLKHIHLHDLPKLREICPARIYAPVLESVYLRGCWGIRHLPAVGSLRRPVVRCERDCWEKMDWDGLHADHHPSLFRPQYSSRHYRKRHLRGTVLR